MAIDLYPADLNPLLYEQRMEAGGTAAQQRAAGVYSMGRDDLQAAATGGVRQGFLLGRQTAPPAPTGIASLQDTFEEKRDVYRGILGDPEAQREGAQADALFAIANFGLQLAGATGGRVGATFGEKLAQAAEGSKVLPTISGVAKNYRDANQKFDLAALGAAESERTAALAAEADRTKAGLKAQADAAAAKRLADARVEAARLKADATLLATEEERAFQRNKFRVELGNSGESFNSVNENGDTIRMNERFAMDDNWKVTRTLEPFKGENDLPVVVGRAANEYKNFVNDKTGNTETWFRPVGAGPEKGQWKQLTVGGTPAASTIAKTEFREVPGKNDKGNVGIWVTEVNSVTGKRVPGTERVFVPGGQRGAVTQYRTLREITAGESPTGKPIPANTTLQITAQDISKYPPGTVERFTAPTSSSTGQYISMATIPGGTIPGISGDTAAGKVMQLRPDQVSAAALMLEKYNPATPPPGEIKTIIMPFAPEGSPVSIMAVQKGPDFYDLSGTKLNMAEERFLNAFPTDPAVAYEQIREINEQRSYRTKNARLIFGNEMEILGATLQNPTAGSMTEPRTYTGKNGETLTEQSTQQIIAEGLPGIRPESRGLYITNAVTAAREGIGFRPKLLTVINQVGGAVFSGMQDVGITEVAAGQYINSLNVLVRVGLSNSPKFAEGEQVRLKELVPTAEFFFKNPKAALLQMANIKRELKNRQVNLTGILANERDEVIRRDAKTRLIATESALIMLQDVPARGFLNDEDVDAIGANIRGQGGVRIVPK